MFTSTELDEYKEEFLDIVRTHITRPGVDNLIEWLLTTDFFTAPASTGYHSAYPGGLLVHSLNVFKALVKLNDEVNKPLAHPSKQTDSITMENMAIAALFHDLCKVNYYIPQTKWTKDEATNQWKSYQGYKIKDTFPLGHGEKSVIILQQFIRLTGEEICAIRWHMGFSDPGTFISIYEKNAFFEASERIPLVTLTSMADVYASFMMEPRFDPKENAM